jgi:hypothetical protein
LVPSGDQSGAQLLRELVVNGVGAPVKSPFIL